MHKKGRSAPLPCTVCMCRPNYYILLYLYFHALLAFSTAFFPYLKNAGRAIKKKPVFYLTLFFTLTADRLTVYMYNLPNKQGRKRP